MMPLKISRVWYSAFLIHLFNIPAMELPKSDTTNEAILTSLYVLKTIMRDIIHSDDYTENEKRPMSPPRRKSMSDLKQKFDCELALIKSEFLYDSASLTFSAYRNINSILTIMDDDETACRAEDKYFRALESYFDAYKKNCYAAFAYIPAVLEYILEIEQMRKRYKEDLYTPSQKCQELIPALEQLIQQEKNRRNNKIAAQNNALKKN